MNKDRKLTKGKEKPQKSMRRNMCEGEGSEEQKRRELCT